MASTRKSQSKKQSSGSNHTTEMSTPTHSELNDSYYEDDFEESSNKHSPVLESDIHMEKGQRESSGEVPSEKDRVREHIALNSDTAQSASVFDDLQSDDSEPEPEGDVMFTEDQHRAMMELMAQKHASGDYSDDPPEYNVKERLKELNAELAMEPEPDAREHKVGFKQELVDLVAPPPEDSDDEDHDSPLTPLTHDIQSDKMSDKPDNKKQYVVERDGKFDIVADNELSTSERAMFDIPQETSDDSRIRNTNDYSQTRKTSDDSQTSDDCRISSNKEGGKVQSNSGHGNKVQPLPPSKPRPNTANSFSRRSVHSYQSPRPQTASSNHSSSSNRSTLQDFNYNSPYAMSSSEKERARERARLREQQRKEEEKRLQDEEEYRRQESECAFNAWLHNKAEDDHRRRQEDNEGQRRNRKENMAKENEEAFRSWMKHKQCQLKQEKLLKRREEQGIKEGYFVRSREQCDNAYRQWLKKKYAEFRKHRAEEKERLKAFQAMARKSRKQTSLSLAMSQPPSSRFVDFYGYRF